MNHMELKDFFQKIRKPEGKTPEYFFALEIDKALVKVAVWIAEGGIVKILSIGQSQAFEKEDQLIEAVDQSISSVTEKIIRIQGIKEPEKTILGLPKEWTEDNSISKEKSILIKDICRQLDLIPIGFVVITEAVIYHLKTIEGVPPTAIFVRVLPKEIILTLTKLGEIVGNEAVVQSGNFSADVVEGLSRFGEEIFPPRILLSDGEEDLNEKKQELLNYSWQESGLNFLHLPKVEILPADFDIKAVALAGGREIAKAEKMEDFSPVEEEITSAMGAEESQPLVSPAPIPKEKETEQPAVDVKREKMGFIAEDITQVQPLDEGKNVLQETKEETEQVGEIPKGEGEMAAEKKKIFFSLADRLKTVKINFRFPAPIFPKKIFLFLLLGLLLIFMVTALVVADSWYFPRAEITLEVRPKPLDQEYTVIFDPRVTTPDEEKLIFPTRLLAVNVEGEETGPTTGVKSVGEPANGEVTVYNRTASRKVFPAGTEITGPGDLKFVFDEEVTVASESAGPDYTSIPGRSTVRVTAKRIGPEGNLAANSEFTIGNFARSDFIARNESAFSGGTSREVPAVVKEDQEKLLAKLSERLKTEALSRLEEETKGEMKVIEGSLKSKVLEKSFSPELGQEGSAVSLKMKEEFTTLAYDKEELTRFLEKKLGEAIPVGYTSKEEETGIDFRLDKITKSGEAVFKVTVRSLLVANIDIEKIKKDIAGRSLNFADQYLHNLPNVNRAQIVIRGNLIKKFAVVPIKPDNLDIIIRLASP